MTSLITILVVSEIQLGLAHSNKLRPVSTGHPHGHPSVKGGGRRGGGFQWDSTNYVAYRYSCILLGFGLFLIFWGAVLLHH